MGTRVAQAGEEKKKKTLGVGGEGQYRRAMPVSLGEPGVMWGGERFLGTLSRTQARRTPAAARDRAALALPSLSPACATAALFGLRSAGSSPVCVRPGERRKVYTRTYILIYAQTRRRSSAPVGERAAAREAHGVALFGSAR